MPLRFDVYSQANRPCAIPHVTKSKTNSEWKSRYYVAILSGKEERGRLSTAKHFASSLVIFATQNGGVVSGFPSTNCFTFSYMR